MSFQSFHVGHTLLQQLPDDYHYSTEEKIEGFCNLPEGWHYSEGSPPSEAVCEAALELHQAAVTFKFYDIDAYPGIDGEIMLVIDIGSDSHEFTVEPNCTITYIRETEDDIETYYENLSMNDVQDILRKLRIERSWNSSDYSVETILKKTRDDSPDSPSRILTSPNKGAFQWSAGNVFWTVGARSVNISEHFTRTLRAKDLSSSGASHLTFYRMDTH